MLRPTLIITPVITRKAILIVTMVDTVAGSIQSTILYVGNGTRVRALMAIGVIGGTCAGPVRKQGKLRKVIRHPHMAGLV